MTSATSKSPGPSHLDLTAAEFERRLAAHGHAADEIRHLWSELGGMEQEAPKAAVGLGLGAVIAVYLGLLLVVAASVSLLAVYWNDLGPWGVLALAVTYLVTYLVAAELLCGRGLDQPADVLQAVAVGWVGLTVYAVQELGGLWPEAAAERDDIHRGLTVIAVAGLAAAVLLMAARRDPLLMLPMAAATALLAIDLAELVFGATIDTLSESQRVVFVLPLGVAWVAVGLWLDVTRRRPFATWAHWAGVSMVGVAVMAMIPKTVPGFALVGVLGAVALFFSAFVRHWSFTVLGALGVLVATTASIGEFGRLAPAVIAVVGIALIAVGLRWSKWRESIRLAVLARIPAGARELVRRLAP